MAQGPVSSILVTIRITIRALESVSDSEIRIRGFLKCYALYKSTFYLLTYLLTY